MLRKHGANFIGKDQLNYFCVGHGYLISFNGGLSSAACRIDAVMSNYIP